MPVMSGHPASHLGGDAGAGVATAFWWGQQQDGPEDPTSLCQEERARPELQQSTRFVQHGADNAGWAKLSISLPSPVLQQAQDPALGGSAVSPGGGFSPLFSSAFLTKAPKAKKASKTFFPPAAP